MAIALPLLDHLLMPVHQAVQWLSGAPAAADAEADADVQNTPAAASPPQPPGTAGEPRARSHVRPPTAARPTRRWGGPLRSSAGARPLRVVHLPEVRTACGAAGRLLISGRLDDVLAELDRLARAHDAAGGRSACTAQ
jgi:hypothetical protein